VQGWLASPYLEVVLWALVGIVLFRWFGAVESTKQT
jgi:hypothetical protein